MNVEVFCETVSREHTCVKPMFEPMSSSGQKQKLLGDFNY